MDQKRWQQIESLYHEALELSTEARSGFLAGRCAADPELLAEVRSLLESSEKADGFLAESDFLLGLQILDEPPHIFTADQEFGNYQILRMLGRGGMGEVYLAEDKRLRRRIALKVLPADVAADGERIGRFMQEARAASALNHPNIMTIYEIGESGGRHFIASEFVGGETLRERLKRDEPFSGAENLGIARQIAAALAAAHKAGIIHRDIKPENIMLREDGLVKILDFGLAKLLPQRHGETETPGGGEKDHRLPAASLKTEPGMVMGTVAYMSPEQVRGKRTDARSDIWSFGVVLYEMLTGRLPFKGETTSDKIAAILTAEPELAGQSAGEQSEGIRRIIAKMLRKDPSERYQTATGAAADLEDLRGVEETFSAAGLRLPTDPGRDGRTDSGSIPVSAGSSDTDGVSEKPNRRSYKFLPAFLALPPMLLAVAGIFYFYGPGSWSAREPMKITRIFDTGKTIGAAISPDGKFVAHALTDAGKQSLWIKNVATDSNIRLIAPGGDSFSGLTFSGDGNHIYYIKNDAESALFRIPVLGGNSEKILADVRSQISFSPDGGQFAFIRNLSDEENAVIIAGADGGREFKLATRRKPANFGGSVSWSPDGKFIAAPVKVEAENASVNIALIPVESGEIKMLSTQKWRLIEQAVWASDGSGLFATAMGETGESLDQVWFFPLSGGPARLITNDLNQYSGISLTEDAGKLLTIQWQNRLNIWLVPQARSGNARILTSNIYAQYRFIALAPDGRIVFPSNENASGNRDIWIIDADGGNARQLTKNAGGNILPCVTADGRYILFASNRTDGQTFHIWRMKTDGTEQIQITNGAAGERGPICAPDGRTVYYSSGGPGARPAQSRLWKITVDGGDPVQLTDYPTGWKDVSPDGKFIALLFKPDKAAPDYKLGIITADRGEPVRVFDFQKQYSQIKWKPDGRSITFIRTENAVSNIWEQPVSGGPPGPVTGFTAEIINGFDWSRNGDLICARGYEARDPILISNPGAAVRQ